MNKWLNQQWSRWFEMPWHSCDVTIIDRVILDKLSQPMPWLLWDKQVIVFQIKMTSSKGKLFHWPFVRGIHLSPVNSPHRGQWRGALVFYLIYARINGWVNIRKAGDLRRHPAHYDVTVMILELKKNSKTIWSHCSIHYVAECLLNSWVIN